MAGFATAGEGVHDFTDKGFQLAYFIVCDRAAAIKIVTQAWTKLNARCKQENKRTYWRDKYLKRGVTKISRTDGDTLQWLIYFEAEGYEKQQESDGVLTTEILIIRYIKSLVQATTAMSSFYVAVGLHRLMNDYATAEIQLIYEAVTERYLGGDAYRRVKRILMHTLSLRFGSLLRTATLAHGEVRFDPLENQSSWEKLVRKCLGAFVPWSTHGRCPVPAGFVHSSTTLGLAKNIQDLDATETNRCHTFIDPICFGRLTKGLGLDPPETRLSLPKFFVNNPDGEVRPVVEAHDVNLTSTEKEAIHRVLAAESARRKKCVPRLLRILVDKEERTRIVLGHSWESVAVQIESGAQLIEIWTEDKDGDLLLATHLVSYDDSGEIQPAAASLYVKNYACSFAVRPNELGLGALFSVTSVPRSGAFQLFSSLSLPQRLQLAACALLCIGIGWSVAFSYYRLSGPTHTLTPQRNASSQIDAPSQTFTDRAGAANEGSISRELFPYELAARGSGKSSTLIITLPTQSTVLTLRLPLGTFSPRSLSVSLKLLPEQKEIMRESLPTALADERFTNYTVPAEILLDGKDYLVELSGEPRNGKVGTIHLFLFHIIKRN